jgi:hypothetical protein
VQFGQTIPASGFEVEELLLDELLLLLEAMIISVVSGALLGIRGAEARLHTWLWKVKLISDSWK